MVSATHLDWPRGVALNGNLSLGVVPTMPGTYRLWARVTGANGVDAGTGLLRTIVVR